MSTSLNNFFYCPVHQVRFRTSSATSILCEQGGHELGHGFPDQSWWKYCCDCATFWPTRIDSGDFPSSQCVVCERNIDSYFACNRCEVITVESANGVRRKRYSIDPNVGVKPECPGCKTVALTILRAHDCVETGFRYLSARDICPFCGEGIAPSVAPALQTPSVTCWSCGKELTAPFRFCKRCGEAQGNVSTSATDEVSTPEAVKTVSIPVPFDPSSFVIHTKSNDDEAPVQSESNWVSDQTINALQSDWSLDPLAEADEETESESVEERADPTVSAAPPAIGNRTSTTLIPSPYIPPWQSTFAASPISNRRPRWIIAIGAVSFSVLILVAIALFYSNHRPTANNSSKTNTQDPGSQVPADMISIAGGQFIMGNDSGDEYEKPAHSVSITPFLMDRTEVTCEKYLEFIKATGHRAPPQWASGAYSPGNDKLPVTGVDWYDANAFALWAKKRLPTEEEWEFAARAGDGRRYPWGNNWFGGAANAGDSSLHHLANVGSYLSGQTPSGLMDMTGNAWEWTASQLAVYPNGRFSKPPAGDLKVIRGGSWQDEKEQVTTTYRGYLRGSGADDYSVTGFRCVVDVNASSESGTHP